MELIIALMLKHANVLLVGMKGLEPSRLAALVPKTSVSTNSTTSPCRLILRNTAVKDQLAVAVAFVEEALVIPA